MRSHRHGQLSEEVLEKAHRHVQVTKELLEKAHLAPLVASKGDGSIHLSGRWPPSVLGDQRDELRQLQHTRAV